MKITEELKKEQQETTIKLQELVGFINSEEFYTLPEPERNLISQQRIGLELYLSSLTKRLYGTTATPDTTNLVWLSMLYGMLNISSSFSNPSSAEKVRLEEKDFEDAELSDHAI